MAGVILLKLLAFLFVGSTLAVDWDVITDLDRYVQNDDGYFSFREVASYNYGEVTLYIMNMTSQMYQTDEFTPQSIWWHWVGIAIPKDIKYLDTAVLLVEGGSNSGDNVNPPNREELSGVGMSVIAGDIGIITAYIKQVPNQPMWFHNDPTFRRRTEDRIIAWTWRTFLDAEDPDPTVILRMPMTKAAKRGMDTVEAVSKLRAPETNINKFIIWGASKRGWTTWSIGCTDRRVIGIIPLVFSLINLEGGALQSHYMNMNGGWSFALQPYYDEDLTKEFFNEKSHYIYLVEDMWYYKERFTMPVYAMSSTGDEFFLLDDNHNWWNEFPEPKHLMMLPNAEHTMAPHYLQMYETATSWMVSVAEGIPFPTVTWEMGNFTGGGYIRFKTNPPPRLIKVFSATTPRNVTRRDYRLAAGTPGNVNIQLVPWRNNIDYVEESEGVYYAEAYTVEDRWVGFFFEGTWDGPIGYRIVLTSQVNVIPYTRPTGPCYDEESCKGFLT